MSEGTCEGMCVLVYHPNRLKPAANGVCARWSYSIETLTIENKMESLTRKLVVHCIYDKYHLPTEPRGSSCCTVWPACIAILFMGPADFLFRRTPIDNHNLKLVFL
jgi:hypothetical protein